MRKTRKVHKQSSESNRDGDEDWVQLSISVTPEMKKAIQARAAETDRSASSWIRQIVEEHLDPEYDRL